MNSFLKIRLAVVVLVFLAFLSKGFTAQQTPKTNAANSETSPSAQKKPPGEAVESSENTQATKDGEKKEPPKKNVDPDATVLTGREFVTLDGVVLSGSFYSGKADKDTVPVILLHGQGKSREEFAPLITEMKNRGYAVLAFDFRGHGESTYRFPDPKELKEQANVGTNSGMGMMPGMGMQPGPGMMTPQKSQKGFPSGMGGGFPGKNKPQENMMPNPGMMPGMMPQQPTPPQPFKPVEYLEKDFKKADYENMYKFDCLPFYRFLVKENNEERLNLNKLVIIGVDMGGTVGGRMTKQLWSNAKRKNVRSLMVVSPNYDSFSKTIFKNAKCFQKDDVSLLMLVGQLDHRAMENAKNLRDEILGKEKRKDDDPTAMSSPIPIAEFPTERQGGELLKESKLGIPQKIADYIDETLAKHKDKELKWEKK